MAESEGTLIAGRYRLDARLGAAVARVTETSTSLRTMSAWKAFDLRLQRQVFVKLAPAGADSAFAEAHRDLWDRLARVALPGMPAIFDLGDDENGVFLVTEWLDAEPLSEVGRRYILAAIDVGPLIRTILAQGLETLSALHEAGLVHGDCAPGNILISPFADRVWLIDPAPALASGELMATMAFAAPELREGLAQPGPLTDLFALGRVLSALAEHGSTDMIHPLVSRLVEPDPHLRPQSAAIARMTLRRADASGGALLSLRRFEGARSPAPLSPSTVWDGSGARTTFRPSPVDFGGGTVGQAVDWDNWGEAAVPDGSTTEPSSGPSQDPSLDPFAAPPPGPQPYEPPLVGSAPEWSSRTSIGNVPIVPPGQSAGTDADFIVMGPTTVAPGSSFPLELWMGPSAQAATLRERAQQRGVLAESGGSANVRLPGQTTLTACISLPGFAIANPAEHIVWDGSIRNIAFILQSAEGQKPGEYWGTIKLLVGTMPLGMVSFRVTIASAPAPQPDVPVRLDTPMHRFQTAFASYASPDRAEVFKRVQAIRASRVDVFADIVNLRGGERWSDTLMREIAARDIFYLFWSRKAKESRWVEREWRQAIDTRGIEFICPIPLEDPRFAEPPAELADLHFNDWCLAIIQSEKAAAQEAADQAGD